LTFYRVINIIGEEKKFPYTSPSLNTVELREEQLRLISDFLISTEIAEALFSRPGRITPGQKSF
jgi:hypothetical protein